MDATTLYKRLIIAGVLLGLGLGGFFDGIVLHQILQWHHMLSSTGDYPANTVAGLEVNTLWDGYFHLSTYIMTFAGLFVLWGILATLDEHDRRIRWSTNGFIGTLLAGWGTFNLAEGIVNHHILGVHHVRSGGNEPLWDLGFLAWGAVMLIVGIGMARTISAPTDASADAADRSRRQRFP